MLSKEEIENNFIRIETICKKEVCLFNQPIIEGNLNQIKRYIIQLESDKQKLIEKLEEDISELEALNDDYTDADIMEGIYITRGQIIKAKEILSILKGENI